MYIMKENYSFRLDPELVKRVDERAKKEKRSRTNLVEVMMEFYLNLKKSEKKEA